MNLHWQLPLANCRRVNTNWQSDFEDWQQEMIRSGKWQTPSLSPPSSQKGEESNVLAPLAFPTAERQSPSITFNLNLWDFGGQEIYHATHQFFLTHRSLYLLVAESRQEHTDFHYWLDITKLLGGDSPLLLIKNEKHGRKVNLDELELRGRFAHMKDSLEADLSANHGLDDIKRKIKQHLGYLPHVGVPLPKSWVKIRQQLEADDRDHISYQDFLDICQQNGLIDHYFKENLSQYLHDLGIVLHFKRDDLLERRVILKPEWATTAVYRVLDNPQVVENRGRFSRADLPHIWHEDQYAEMRPELLQLMKNFQLCYELPSQRGHYLAPQLLPKNRPAYPWDEEADSLIVHYKYAFMPKGIITRLIVVVQNLIEQQEWVWRNGVVLAREGTRAEVIQDEYGREIYVRVTGAFRRDLLASIRTELSQIHALFGGRLKYEELVPCNCSDCKKSKTSQNYSFKVLKKFISDKQPTIQCRESYQDVNVLKLIGDVMSLQYFAKENKHLQSNLTEMGLQVNHIEHVDKLTITRSAEMKDIEIKDSKVGTIVTGKVNGDVIGGDKVGRDKAGRDIVGGDKVGGVKYTELQDALQQWKAQIIAVIEAREDLDEDEKKEIEEEATETAEKVMAEVKNKARPGRIERLLNTIVSMGDDILEVTATTLANPFAGMGLVLKKINDRIKLERTKEVEQDSAT